MLKEGREEQSLPDDDNDSWRGAHHMQHSGSLILQRRQFLTNTSLTFSLLDLSFPTSFPESASGSQANAVCSSM